MKKTTFGYKQTVTAQMLNERFADLAGGSILNGFRLAKGTGNYSISLRRMNDKPSAAITEDGVRVMETTDVIDAVVIRPNTHVLDRYDVVYVAWRHDAGAEITFDYTVVEGVPGLPVNIETKPTNRLPLGYVRLRTNVAPTVDDLTSLDIGVKFGTLYANGMIINGTPILTKSYVDGEVQKNKERIVTTETEISAARKTYVSLDERIRNELAQKRDVLVPIKGSDLEVSTDAGKIKVQNLADEVLQRMAGTTPVNATPGVGSVTTEKIALGAVTSRTTDFLEHSTINLIDSSKFSNGYIGTVGEVIDSGSFKVSDFIPVKTGTAYSSNAGGAAGGYYDANRNFVQNIAWNASKPYVIPAGVYYARVVFSISQLATARMFEGSVLLDYVPYVTDVKIKDFVKVRYENLQGEFPIGVAANQLRFYTKTKNIFDKTKVQIGYTVSSTTGLLNPESDQNYAVSDFMACKPSTNYVKNGIYAVAFYDATKQFVGGVGFGASARSFTTPPNASFIRSLMYLTQDDIDVYMVYEGTTLPETYMPPYTSKYDEGLKKRVTKKRWVSYGDSLTQMDGWQPIVAQNLALESINRGIGSTTVIETGSIAWVDGNGNLLARPPEAQPVGSSQILSSMSNDQRIATIPTNADVITVMAGTNDIYTNKEIDSTISYSDVTKFRSAYAVMLKKIILRCPRARIITITPPQNNKYDNANTAGFRTRDFANVVIEVSRILGVPCIDLYGQCGWNEFNMSFYLSDGVHYLDTGAKRIAEIVEKGMTKLV